MRKTLLIIGMLLVSSAAYTAPQDVCLAGYSNVFTQLRQTTAANAKLQSANTKLLIEVSELKLQLGAQREEIAQLKKPESSLIADSKQ